MTRPDGAGGNPAGAYADTLCALCGHYGLEHMAAHHGGTCQAVDIFDQPCDCMGFEAPQENNT